jgi:phospholipid/cholesterol/gamma-HCH transport system substrate-binding protein
MKTRNIELIVGIFVLSGIIAISYLSVKMAGLDFFEQDTYLLDARFNSASGLKEGSNVMISGVAVGRIEKISLNVSTYEAIVTIRIGKEIQLDDDTIASVKTNGLIGDKYLALSPGGSGIALNPGDTIIETESALDIEKIISNFAFGNVKE